MACYYWAGNFHPNCPGGFIGLTFYDCNACHDGQTPVAPADDPENPPNRNPCYCLPDWYGVQCKQYGVPVPEGCAACFSFELESWYLFEDFVAYDDGKEGSVGCVPGWSEFQDGIGEYTCVVP